MQKASGFALTLFTLVAIFGCQAVIPDPNGSESGGVVWHVSTLGADRNSGTAAAPFRSINQAAQKAMPGDTVLVHAGVYREQIALPRGGTGEQERIIYRAADPGDVMVKGSEPIRGWKSLGGDVWQVSIDHSFFEGFNPYALKMEGGWLESGEWHSRGEVYLNGNSLFQKKTRAEIDTNALTWFPEVGPTQTTILANFGDANPNQALVEINVREAFVKPERVGLNYITIDGFHFAHSAANWAAPVLRGGTPEAKAAYRQEGGISTRMGKRWIIQNNHITDVKGVGIISGKDAYPVGQTPYEALSTYGQHTIRNNYIARCGQSAIAGFFGLARSRIEGNLIEDINHKQQYGGWETAAIKFHCAVDTIVENNLIRRVFEAEVGGAYGVWIDWGNQSIRVSRNIIYDTDQHAIYLEMNAGPILVDNNLIIGTLRSRGSQALVSAHNIYVESAFTFRDNAEREFSVFAPHSRKQIRRIPGHVQDNKFYNNLIIRSQMHTDFAEQPETEADYNVHLETDHTEPVGGPNSRVFASFESGFERVDSPDGVTIQLRLPSTVREMEGPWVDPALIGDLTRVGHSIQDRFGRPIRIDTDIYDETRPRPLPGPLASPQAENTIIWKLRRF